MYMYKCRVALQNRLLHKHNVFLYTEGRVWKSLSNVEITCTPAFCIDSCYNTVLTNYTIPLYILISSPNPPQPSDLKKRVESLIDRDYIRRSKDNI